MHNSVEENQEKLWNKSLELLKDHLSPTIFEKYGPSTTPTPGPSGTSAPSERESVPLVQELVPLSASADGDLKVEQEGRDADGDLEVEQEGRDADGDLEVEQEGRDADGDLEVEQEGRDADGDLEVEQEGRDADGDQQ